MLLLLVFLCVTEDLDAFLPELFHLFKRRTSVYVALVIAKLLLFVRFSFFMHEIVLVDYFWCLFSLLNHFFVAWPSENVVFVYTEG